MHSAIVIILRGEEKRREVLYVPSTVLLLHCYSDCYLLLV